MTGYLGKRTNQNRDIVGRQIQNQQENQWGPIPGEIVSYDHTTGTATVQPLYKPIHNGKPVDMPQLFEVPVDIPRTGSAGMTFPVPPGTKVMLTPAMRSMDNYEAGEGGQPFDGRSFHLADMRASIAGGDSLSEPLSNVDPDNTHVRFSADGSFGIKGSPDGKFRIDGAEGNLYDIIATFMELVAGDQLQIAYGSSAGSGHALQNRAALLALAAKVRAMAL